MIDPSKDFDPVQSGSALTPDEPTTKGKWKWLIPALGAAVVTVSAAAAQAGLLPPVVARLLEAVAQLLVAS